MTTTTTDPITCTHRVKSRLLGRDARLYECIGEDLDPKKSTGCGGLFVNGYTWRGEPDWIVVPTPISCDYCLDGYGDFLLPTYTQYPNVCEKCGTACKRMVATEVTV